MLKCEAINDNPILYSTKNLKHGTIAFTFSCNELSNPYRMMFINGTWIPDESTRNSNEVSSEVGYEGGLAIHCRQIS